MIFASIMAAAALLLAWLLRDLYAGLAGIFRAGDAMAEIAYEDPLTGLPNRRAANRAIEMALERARRAGKMVAIHSLDVDGLKPVNDRHGHAAGDAMLREIARRLSECVRMVDSVARIGGDEFEVIQCMVDSRSEAEQLKARLKDCLREPITVDGLVLRCGVSVGYALYPEDAAVEEDLRRLADAEMYRAKRARSEMVIAA